MININDNDELSELLGVPTTSVLPAEPGDILIVKVNKRNSEQQMWAHANRIKEILPDYKIIVIPDDVEITMFPEDYARRMITMVKTRRTKDDY